MHLETERQPAMTLVHCTGQVDVESWTGLSTTVRALIPEGKPIRVDLAKVTPVSADVTVFEIIRKSPDAETEPEV